MIRKKYSLITTLWFWESLTCQDSYLKDKIQTDVSKAQKYKHRL